MEKNGVFADFDDQRVYEASLGRALNDSALNFVVEFGKDEAEIAFDLDAGHIERVLADSVKPPQRPVRWINIWAPNRQKEVINLIGKHYKFSPRLLAILQTAPPESKRKHDSKHVNRFKAMKMKHTKEDVETAAKSINLSNGHAEAKSDQPTPSQLLDQSHYGIAAQMINYQSIDFGQHFLCIGANWMHELLTLKPPNEQDRLLAEGKERRIWSWIVLCDDNTVISLHEDTGRVKLVEDMKSIRSNTLSVLRQISKFGHAGVSPISMQTVRQVLDLDAAQINPGIEGASNLFYYLFDDWRAVFITVAKFRTRLDNLQSVILEDMTRKASTSPDIRIIPRLHILGRQIRQMQHLYAAYKNLIQRMLEPKLTVAQGVNNSSINTLASGSGRSVVLARSASQRFERLGDRIKLLILSETSEFLAEKDALISTYFNINAQKDSEATARLTRSATLLAKLSVLFLPVSLMTSYFSTQIAELQDAYSAKDYWYSFATIMSISFLSLFFFSKMLIHVTEWLDVTIKKTGKKWQKGFNRLLKRGKKEEAEGDEEDEDEDEDGKWR